MEDEICNLKKLMNALSKKINQMQVYVNGD